MHDYLDVQSFDGNEHLFIEKAMNITSIITSTINPNAKNCTLRAHEKVRGHPLNPNGTLDTTRCVVMKCEDGYRINRKKDRCVKFNC